VYPAESSISISAYRSHADMEAEIECLLQQYSLSQNLRPAKGIGQSVAVGAFFASDGSVIVRLLL